MGLIFGGTSSRRITVVKVWYKFILYTTINYSCVKRLEGYRCKTFLNNNNKSFFSSFQVLRKNH